MSDLEEAKKSLTAFLEETEKRLAAFRKATDIWPPGENLPPNRFFDEAQIRAKAYGYWLKAEAEISKLKEERDSLRRALAPLYEHTKNNLQICGLTEQARQALKNTMERNRGINHALPKQR